jgi:hypothetical protein
MSPIGRLLDCAKWTSGIGLVVTGFALDALIDDPMVAGSWTR